MPMASGALPTVSAASLRYARFHITAGTNSGSHSGTCFSETASVGVLLTPLLQAHTPLELSARAGCELPAEYSAAAQPAPVAAAATRLPAVRMNLCIAGRRSACADPVHSSAGWPPFAAPSVTTLAFHQPVGVCRVLPLVCVVQSGAKFRLRMMLFLLLLFVLSCALGRPSTASQGAAGGVLLGRDVAGAKRNGAHY